MATKCPPPPTASDAPGMIRMPLSIFNMAGVGAIDVYGCLTGSRDPTLLWDRKFQFKDDDVASLPARGVDAVWVTRIDAIAVAQQLRQSWSGILHDSSYAPCERYALLQIAVAPEFNATYRLLNCGRYVELARKTALDLAGLLVDGKTAPLEFFGAVQHDGSPGIRATNLAGYAVLLAIQCDVKDDAQLQEIAAGAMLHDLGARMLAPERILAFNRLAPMDRAAVEKHPRASYELLLNCGSATRGQLMMAYQHHERIDGSGYPVAIMGDEIHPWAKMLAIVDCFDSFTNGQRKSSDLAEALAQLNHAAGTHFESEMVACWSSSLQSG